MSIEFIEILDTALEQLRKKDSIPKILDRHPDQAEDLVSLLLAAEALISIQSVETPSAEAMKSDRTKFLASIEQTKIPVVSPGLFVRLKGWIESIIPRTHLRKEKQKMSTLIARATLVIALLFGVTTGAYAVTANSLPDGPLYGAKLAIEQVQLNMAPNPAGIATRHLVMAQNRFQEIILLSKKGSLPDNSTMTRLENHLNTALEFAAILENDGEMHSILMQAQALVQEQLKTMNRIQIKGDDPSQEPLRMTLRILNQFQNQVETGLQDPQTFRWQHQYGQSENPVPGGPGHNPDCPNCPCENCDPNGDGNKYGQDKADISEVSAEALDSVSGECVPPGDENKYGQTNESPPGSPGGNPDCPSDDCVPSGDENKYGQKEEGASGGPGDNPDCPNCPCEDCEPASDQNQFGPTGEEPPGGPGGNPDCPCDECMPEGDKNQNGLPEEDAPQQPNSSPDCPSGSCVPGDNENGPKKP